jgi:hypothetical protein
MKVKGDKRKEGIVCKKEKSEGRKTVLYVNIGEKALL